jgi:hypothetical protein
MAIIVLIAADPERQVHFLPAVKRKLAAVPAGLAVALVVFVAGYWGLHRTFYGSDGIVGQPSGEMATHSHSPEHPHGPQATGRFQAPLDRAESAPTVTR